MNPIGTYQWTGVGPIILQHPLLAGIPLAGVPIGGVPLAPPTVPDDVELVETDTSKIEENPTDEKGTNDVSDEREINENEDSVSIDSA